MTLTENVKQFQPLPLSEELTITPIRGYREWAFITGQGLLISSWDKSIWPMGKAKEAVCRYRCKQIPSENDKEHMIGSGCGLYAWHRPEAVRVMSTHGLSTILFNKYRPRYWGVVQTEGNARVVWHSKGFRASNLRIIALADTGKNSRIAAMWYDVPVLPPGEMMKQYPPSVEWDIKKV